jgi:cob(I)alamin adenosyltransferase
MGLLDKAKAAAEQAAAKAKDTAGDLQTKRELGQAYDELGRKAFELAESGELPATPLEPLLERIRELRAQLDEQPEVIVPSGAETSE